MWQAKCATNTSQLLRCGVVATISAEILAIRTSGLLGKMKRRIGIRSVCFVTEKIEDMSFTSAPNPQSILSRSRYLQFPPTLKRKPNRADSMFVYWSESNHVYWFTIIKTSWPTAVLAYLVTVLFIELPTRHFHSHCLLTQSMRYQCRSVNG